MPTFTISKKIMELFNCITNYYGIDQFELIRQWKKEGAKYPKFATTTGETETLNFDIGKLDSEEREATSYLFSYVIQDKNQWLDGHIKEFCITKMKQLIGEISGYVPSNETCFVKKLKVSIPTEFHNYLLQKDQTNNTNITYQYENAFRNTIVPDLDTQTGENFWEIKDIGRLLILKETYTNTPKSALSSYINFLAGKNENIYKKNEKEVPIKIEELTPYQKEVFNYIAKHGRAKEKTIFAYVHTYPKMVVKYFGFDILNTRDPHLIAEWIKKFRGGEYDEFDLKYKRFHSTSFDWYRKYLEENS